MLILALDTSSLSGSVAALRDESLLGVVSTRGSENYSSRLFRHLDFLLQDLSLKLQDFDLFAVSAGPGSFTGLRVGLAAAKGWAEVYAKPVAGISALEAVAAQSPSRSRILVPVLDARRSQFYFGIYRNLPQARTLEGDERVATPDEFVDAIRDFSADAPVTIVAADAALLGGVMPRLNDHLAQVDIVSCVLAPAIGRLGLERARFGVLSDSLSLDANYVRRSDAELNWKCPQ
ncbi:MAG: tRNA (adenosine(37)-N6)-threonylcarbamoyltransferase complex dimerization subunit type 1 TsaB [Candidatus Acidiferrales bacterium]